MTPNEKKHLTYAIVEAIWMSLENMDDPPKDLISELFELAGGGAKGRAGVNAQQLYYYIERLATDIDYAIDGIPANTQEPLPAS